MIPQSHALILIDLQRDYLSNGKYPIKNAEAVFPYVNDLIKNFDTIVASQDYHQASHQTFLENNKNKNLGDIVYINGLKQVVQPTHCVQFTKGVNFAPYLDREMIIKVFTRGHNPGVDGWSAFFDIGRKSSTYMGEWLRGKEVKKVSLVGFDLEGCVKNTALDALSFGFEVDLYLKGCKGRNKFEINFALKELYDMGIKIIE